MFIQPALAALIIYLLISRFRRWVRRMTSHAHGVDLLKGRESTSGQWARLESTLEASAREWPKGPQVYACYDDEGTVVYVGKTNNVRTRFNQHGHTSRAWTHNWTTWRSWAVNKREQGSIETELILLWNPKGNVQLKRSRTL